MGELPPLGRTKPIRVPVGKEHEYGENARGDPVHLVYGEDEEVPGTVLPSASPATVSPDGRRSAGGGSPGFDVNDLDIQQNIIVFGEGGEQIVTKVSRADLLARGTGPAEKHDLRRIVTPAEVARRGERAEEIFKGAEGAALLAPPSTGKKTVWGSVPTIEEGGSDVTAKKAKKKKAKKKAKNRKPAADAQEQSLSRAGESPPAVAREPIPVTLSGAFGSIVQYFSGIIKQGVSLVLVTDHRQIEQAYSPPPATGEEPLELTVSWDDQEVECFWAGIQFTMPDGSVTFTVLLAPEEEGHGEGLPG